MKVALVRHGQALDHPRDELRQLSPKGIEQANKAGAFLSQTGFVPKMFFHSPLKRAIETCHIINTSFFNSIQSKLSEELCPMSPLSFWNHELETYEQDIILVGHNPYMSQFATELSGRAYQFPTGGCVVLEKSVTTSHWLVSAINF